MIKCPNCGTDNRDTSRFCRVCGKALPITRSSAPSSLPAPRPPTATPAQPQKLPSARPSQLFPQVSPAQSMQVPSPRGAAAQPLTTRLQTALNPTTNLRGTVMDDPSERRDFPPRDWAKAMVGVAVAILVLPPLAAALFTASLVMCAIALLGGGAILTCLFLPLGLFAGLAGLLRGPQRAEVPIYEFRVQDQSGNVVNVEMIGRRRGGKISRGDEVEAEGEWLDAYHTALRAWRVQIHRVVSIAGAQQAGSVVTADRPWPKVVGWSALAIAIAVTVIVYGWPVLTAMLSSVRTP